MEYSEINMGKLKPQNKPYLTDLDIIPTKGGAVLHAMKAGDTGFLAFGEAYFSVIESGAIKAWKRHKKMTLNLVVPVGRVKFIIFDKIGPDVSSSSYQSFTISADNYKRLTVPPLLWFGFQGVGDHDSLVLNIADICHNPDEVERRDLNAIKFNWGLDL